MENQSLQKWNETKIVPIKEQRKEALWEVVYGIEKFYLTNEEKEYFLNALQSGAKFVDIKGNILTDKFLYISVDLDTYSQLKSKVKYSKYGEPLTPLHEEFYKEKEQATPEQIEEWEKNKEIARENARKTLRDKGLKV